MKFCKLNNDNTIEFCDKPVANFKLVMQINQLEEQEGYAIVRKYKEENDNILVEEYYERIVNN